MRNAPDSEGAPVGVFVGLATLDVIHRIGAAPAVNQKITSTAQFVAAGGPAANAAVTFAALGGRAILVTALGEDPVADVIRADLAAYGVRVVDAATGTSRAVPVSSVAVVESTGDRSVVSLDAVTSDASPPPGLGELLADADVVLVDGHHPLIARAAAEFAAARGVTLVVDAGRWKPVMGELVSYATDMVCSDDFRMPGADDPASTAAALVRSGVRTVVTTHGGEPVQWWSAGERGSVPVEPVVVVDTLGAGDVFHGAYSYFSTQSGRGVAERIDRSARVAALRCSVIGPRAWLSELPTQQTRKRER
ncbi:PfkB family carbohydrate kinase [Mycolicibacterium fluoranthenivorans]|uniref:Sugar/nucleoside kinase (Ribokinase family) n=1 Tax=Mycolicibacterium fluoranthenivorans TaxID=258505 RepID=A0A7X5R4Q1_9MYCO|nr:PfkB family carbohydrate kinase [Mycolicibacterium fluoranthenivorans]MCV7358699.1 kinase [Mycolicibacterium fluoranthenivorans]NIH93307.1 sugar/nucleoside kinase (ribokinase family) [Mycolicibacterium fluoranthenivorans]